MAHFIADGLTALRVCACLQSNVVIESFQAVIGNPSRTVDGDDGTGFVPNYAQGQHPVSAQPSQPPRAFAPDAAPSSGVLSSRTPASCGSGCMLSRFCVTAEAPGSGVSMLNCCMDG